MQLILASGADINAANTPFPPLHNFADFNNIIAIRFLLDAGADRTTLNSYRQTALQRAENRGNEEAAALLRSYKKEM